MFDEQDEFGGEIQREPLAGPHESYQSHILSIDNTVNPMVAASAALISEAIRLKQLTSKPDYKQLHESLLHEIKALESRAHQLGYRSRLILSARYMLCALIDEIIQTSHWSSKDDWSDKSLLQTLQRETTGGERFYTIVQRGMEDPQDTIDALELGYICLSLGFQGKYSTDSNERSTFIDNLQNLIAHQRGEVDNTLHFNLAKKTPRKFKQLRLPPAWLTAMMAGIIMLAIYIPYHQRLSHLAQPAFKAISAIQ